MDKKIIIKQILDSLETIQEQTALVVSYDGQIPQIELDILMNNVTKYYEQLTFLNKLNSFYTVAVSKDKIVSANEIERENKTKKFKSETLVSVVTENNEEVKKPETINKIFNTIETVATPIIKQEDIVKEPYVKPEITQEKEIIVEEKNTKISADIFIPEEVKPEAEKTPEAIVEVQIAEPVFPLENNKLEEKLVEIPLFSFKEKNIIEEENITEVTDSKTEINEVDKSVENLNAEKSAIVKPTAVIDVEPIVIAPTLTFFDEGKPIVEIEKIIEEPVKLSVSEELTEASAAESDEDKEVSENAKQAKEPKQPKEKSKRKGKVVLDLFSELAPSVGDKFKDEKPNLNERIGENQPDASITSKIQKQPVANLKKAIGINEKFQYINELFGGNIQDYSNAINHLNDTCTNIAEAREFLDQLRFDHKWDSEQDAVFSFTTLVERRFI